MGVLKYVHYLYIVVAVLFVYEGVTQLQAGENYIISFLFAAAALFMFFFRRHFSDKMKR